ncbi:MAG: hypothetical protein V4641_09770 [Pseudomonadota bacterium]
MSMAIKYNMAKRAKKMAMGGTTAVDAADGCAAPKGDVVDRAMAKRKSQGGIIANGTPPVADGESADYDVMKDDDLESTNTGASDGDDLGDAKVESESDDVVSRAMRKRKDKNPRPA